MLWPTFSQSDHIWKWSENERVGHKVCKFNAWGLLTDLDTDGGALSYQLNNFGDNYGRNMSGLGNDYFETTGFCKGGGGKGKPEETWVISDFLTLCCFTGVMVLVWVEARYVTEIINENLIEKMIKEVKWRNIKICDSYYKFNLVLG